MKSIELFCASPASTAICSSLDQNSMVRRGIRRQIDGHTTTHHHHHRLGGGGRTPRHHHHAPCSSPIPPFDPKPYFQKGRKSDAVKDKRNDQLRRRSSADVTDLAGRSSPDAGGSSRYLLLTDNPAFESDASVSSAALVPYEPSKDKQLRATELPLFRSASARSPVYRPFSQSLSQVQKSSSSHAQVHKSSSTLSTFGDQVVELRVSIHCKGCEGKVRKHLSKMEGVTSFSIDLASKKVTIIGKVTPLGVLASISKVKNAQFWASPSQSSSTSSSSSTPISSSSSSMSRRA